jgi:radical SAM protein with 4Fe4S-binding SPASM domain
MESLKEIGYSDMISFSRYNEPLADSLIYERLKQAKEYVPNAFLHFNTNGDYLDVKALNKLAAVGLKGLNIQVYQDSGFSEEYAKAKIAIMGTRLGLALTPVKEEGSWIEYRAKYESINIRIYSRDFKENGVDRGGTVDIVSHDRLSPCLMPIRNVYIDFTGKVMPCCNLRSDVLSHEKYIVGDLNNEDSLFSLYASEKIIGWRKHLINYGTKNIPCKRCNYIEHPRNAKNEKAIAPFVKFDKSSIT